MNSEYTELQAADDQAKILEALRALTTEARERLQSAIDAAEALDKDEHGEWSWSEGAFPYLNEAVEVEELRAALYDAGLVVPIYWRQWLRTLDNTTDLPVDDPVSAVRTITAILRGNRTTEGLVVSRLGSGQLTKAIRMAMTG